MTYNACVHFWGTFRCLRAGFLPLKDVLFMRIVLITDLLRQLVHVYMMAVGLQACIGSVMPAAEAYTAVDCTRCHRIAIHSGQSVVHVHSVALENRRSEHWDSLVRQNVAPNMEPFTWVFVLTYLILPFLSSQY